MRSRLDREISRRLLQEVPTEPTVKNSRIDQLLCRVRAEDVQDNSKVVRAFSYRTAVAAVGAAIMLTTGTYAAVDNYHEHLQSMSQEEQKQLNHMTQAQREDADHYSRKLYSQEQKRKELLQKEYKKGTLPETKLKEVDSQKEVKANGGKEVVYCRANSTLVNHNTDIHNLKPGDRFYGSIKYNNSKGKQQAQQGIFLVLTSEVKGKRGQSREYTITNCTGQEYKVCSGAIKIANITDLKKKKQIEKKALEQFGSKTEIKELLNKLKKEFEKKEKEEKEKEELKKIQFSFSSLEPEDKLKNQ